jgi:hypothetical protein
MITVSWKEHTLRSRAIQIAAASGVPDVVYILSKRRVDPTGFQVQRFSPARNRWFTVATMGAVRVAVSPQG